MDEDYLTPKELIHKHGSPPFWDSLQPYHNCPNTLANQRVKYAWYRYKGLPIPLAKKLSRKSGVPPELIDDLDKWFYYEDGRLTRDDSNGADNLFRKEISEKIQKLLGNPLDK